jgi:hypothetical protein
MTEQSGVLVSELLPDSFSRMDQVVQSELSKNASVGEAKLPRFAWHLIESQTTKALHDVLACDVFELLARAWCTARELHKYADESEHPRTERSIVSLGEHVLATAVHPVIVVIIGSLRCPPLRFTLELNATFRSAVLLIRGGYIKSLSAGDCTVGAQLKYGEQPLHDELKSKTVTVPGQFDFAAPGLKLG